MSMANKQVRLSSEELHQIKQLMGALLALLSFWSLASLDMGSRVMLFLGAAASAVSFVMPEKVARIPSVVWKWAGPIILFVIGADFILHLPEFIPPLVRMVVLLIIYRMLAPRNRREDLQVILLCLFCVVISGVLTVSLLFAFQILIFTPLSMALLFIICVLDRGEETKAYVIDWTNFRWSRMAQRAWSVLDLRILGLSAIMFAIVVSVSTFLFILTPRFNFDQAIPFLQLTTQPRSGFSEDVSLGDVSEIQEDNSVALRIDVPSLDAVSPSPYWRMLILDKYANGRFGVSPSLLAKPLRVFKKEREIRTRSVPIEERDEALWTIYMEGGVSRYLPIPGDFAGLRFQNFEDLEIMRDVHVLGLDAVGQNVFSYQLEDLQFNQRFTAGDVDIQALSSLPIEVAGREDLSYPLTCLELNLTDESIAILADFNETIYDGRGLSVADYSEAVTDFLWQRFAYSLRPDGNRSGGVDPIVGWLESGTRGHCELFAGAFVLLAREAGFPARMVVGFAGGSWNGVEDYFVVRNSDAHAWVEIYDPEQQNWLRVDPTPGRGSSDPEVIVQARMNFESGMAAWIDSLRIQWYRRIVNFEQEDQVELATTLKEVLGEYYANFKYRLNRVLENLRTLFTSPFEGANFLLFLIPLTLLWLLYLFWRIRYSVLNFIFRIMRKPKALDPVRRQASRYLKRLAERELESEVVLELKALRFGPEMSLRDAAPVFERARLVLKNKA